MTIFTDGGARGNPGPAAAAFVVIDKDGNIVYRAGRYLGRATNNVAEYTAVCDALHWLKGFEVTQKLPDTITFKLDSLLVVQQLNGRFKIKNPALIELVGFVQKLRGTLPVTHFVHVPRAKNRLADALVNETLDSQPLARFT